jgi:thymidylate synthase
MRIYQDATEMVREVERDLFEMGVRYQSGTVQDQLVEDDPMYQTIELVGYAYSLTDVDQDDLTKMMKYMNANVDWAVAEKMERLHRGQFPPNPGQAYAKNYDFWMKFMRNGCFSYSYAERWWDQLPYVIRELRARPNTRQAVMTMYDVHQDMMNWGGRDRVPCSLTYQFVIRDGVLSLIYNQRSCDFMKFFATDVFLTCELLRHVAGAVDAEIGRFVHFLGSLHAFAGDLQDRKIF